MSVSGEPSGRKRGSGAPKPATPRTAPGSPLAVPPAWLPLSWLAAAGIGLIGFGIALAVEADAIVDAPQSSSAIATVHLAMLAFLTTAVLGAAHQFGPVVAARRLRSARAGLVTLVLWIIAAWTLPFAFATQRPALLQAAGVTAFVAVCLAAWNLSGPLLRRGRGTPVLGLRLAVIALIATAAFGATYAFDRHHGWFILLPRRVLAHAHLGLIGWIGLAYVAVAEKLWPMFLLAHRPSADSGVWAVRLVATGIPFVVLGLMIPSAPVAWFGALVVCAGLGCHLVSLASVIRFRRRRLELLHAYVLTSAVMLIVAAWAAFYGAVVESTSAGRLRAVQTEVIALTFWLGLAVIGHAHKIVPFISWSRLRASGHTKSPEGKPLMFAHLVHRPTARATYAAAVTAAVSGVAGVATGTVLLVHVSGLALVIAGFGLMANLTSGPLRIISADRRRADASAPKRTIPVAVGATSFAGDPTPAPTSLS